VVFAALDVVPTPGHTQGHAVFVDPAARLLFAGDHVLPSITPSVGFEPVLSANPLGISLSHSPPYVGCRTACCCRRTARSR